MMHASSSNVAMLNARKLASLTHWTGVDPRTITRWYAGFTVRKATAILLADAVREHDFPRPHHMTARTTRKRAV